jgi:hypothetical protein
VNLCISPNNYLCFFICIISNNVYISASFPKEEIQLAVIEAMDRRDRANKADTVAMSGASLENTSAIFRKLNIMEDVLEDDTIDASSASVTSVCVPSFTPFCWNGRNETEATPDAFIHLKKELDKFLDIKFGRDGFKLVDVHSSSKLLSFEDPKVAKLSGGTDIVCVPYKTANSSMSNQLCVLFELKTDEKIEEFGFNKFVCQAKLEMLSARCLSHQPNVLLILTDLSSGAILFWFEYDVKNDAF